MQMIRNLQINNYKSIRELHLNCSKINVLIGEPNVGKSNILEALDLSYLSWMLAGNVSKLKVNEMTINIKDFFRVENVADLFHFGDISKPILIDHPGFSYGTFLKFNNENDKNVFELGGTASVGITEFDNDFIPKTNTQFHSSPLKPYKYKEDIYGAGSQFHDIGNNIDKLVPPYGNNLLEVIKYNADFGKFIGELIADFELELNSDIANHKLWIQKRINPGLVYSLPYRALADTLKRVIFYTAAIRHNNGSVITLEEPDAHSFPKFVSFLADEIIQNNKNQFFIATHNPYFLNNLIENTPSDELAVFVCGYHKDKGTIAKKLSIGDLSELLDYGVDIFFNINRYLDENIEHIS
jgi:AAA15 family ATPase/GTPase